MNLNNELDEEWMNFNENGNFESNKKSNTNELINDIKCRIFIYQPRQR